MFEGNFETRGGTFYDTCARGQGHPKKSNVATCSSIDPSFCRLTSALGTNHKPVNKEFKITRCILFFINLKLPSTLNKTRRHKEARELPGA